MATLAIIGSRGFTDYNLLSKAIATYFPGIPRFTTVVSGGAFGADRLGAEWVKRHKDLGIELVELKPNWSANGRAAGFARNVDIIRKADEVLAFWDGKSRGTAHSLSVAKMLKKPTVVIYF